ncbi:MAG TPA: heme-binding protein [Gemmatimonadales bacterium]|nr:heme-binding protein [Gemmatimonadales bacterium]
MTHLRQLPTLTLAGAKAIAAAAEAFAVGRGWTVAVAVVDAAGGLVLFQILDDTQPGSQEVAVHKARTAARFKRPTKALEEAVAGGRQALLSLPGATAVEGGLPIVVGGRVVGAVGVSGMQSSQDSQVAEAGLAAFRPE